MLELKNQGRNDDSNSMANNSKIQRKEAVNVESSSLKGKQILNMIYDELRQKKHLSNEKVSFILSLL